MIPKSRSTLGKPHEELKTDFSKNWLSIPTLCFLPFLKAANPVDIKGIFWVFGIKNNELIALTKYFFYSDLKRGNK
jgi:hypothetical protein